MVASTGRRKSVVAVRVFFGFALTAGFGALLFIDFITETNYATTAGALAVVCLGIFEYYRMQENRRIYPFRTLGIAAGALLVAAQWFRWFLATESLLPVLDPVWALLILSWLFLAFQALTQHRDDKVVDRLAHTAMGLLYVWLPTAFLFEMRNAQGLSAAAGVTVILHLLVTAKIGDVGAFFTGRFLGRHRLAPTLSPGKTVEGSVGGLVMSIAFSALLCVALGELNEIYGLVGGLIFGLAVGITSQAGDLFESLLKRKAKVKNSGEIIPEFGGMLDLLDSLLFSGPVACFLLLCYI